MARWSSPGVLFLSAFVSPSALGLWLRHEGVVGGALSRGNQSESFETGLKGSDRSSVTGSHKLSRLAFLKCLCELLVFLLGPVVTHASRQLRAAQGTRFRLFHRTDGGDQYPNYIDSLQDRFIGKFLAGLWIDSANQGLKDMFGS
jgi:hypothetical protein